MNRIIEYILDKLEVVDCIPEWLKKPLRNILNKDIKKRQALADKTSTPSPATKKDMIDDANDPTKAMRGY